jgi:hypothetical protein
MFSERGVLQFNILNEVKDLSVGAMTKSGF